jgi:hypothetical protein
METIVDAAAGDCSELVTGAEDADRARPTRVVDHATAPPRRRRAVPVHRTGPPSAAGRPDRPF